MDFKLSLSNSKGDFQEIDIEITLDTEAESGDGWNTAFEPESHYIDEINIAGVYVGNLKISELFHKYFNDIFESDVEFTLILENEYNGQREELFKKEMWDRLENMRIDEFLKKFWFEFIEDTNE